MAIIRLMLDELDERVLPRVCMCCGAPAVLLKHKRFVWVQDWVKGLPAHSDWLALLLVLPLVLLGLRMLRVPIPLCQRHRHHWRPLNVVLYGGLSAVALLGASALVLWRTSAGQGDPRSELADWLCIGGILVFLCLLFPAAILHARTIRAFEITPTSITLTNVAMPFVRALDNSLEETLADRPGTPSTQARSERITRQRKRGDDSFR
jgi:hypothetical protein